MYRVELKEKFFLGNILLQIRFLMYRVELKVVSSLSAPAQKTEFLMYRVELKVATTSVTPISFKGWEVPNVPCGVER